MTIGLIIVCVIISLIFLLTFIGAAAETIKRIKEGKEDIANESAGDPTGDPD